jgi:hypothetical protein
MARKARNFRTAVLVVHGMGSQRPLETLRGVINAVWFDNDDHTKDKKHKLWSHPEPSGVDLDLTVMTTNGITGAEDGRIADFHELYWAHLLSETKAVAVLLWLFELGRKGPKFKTGMNGLWWCGAVFLCLLLLSVAQLVIQAMVWFAGTSGDTYGIPLTAYLMIAVAIVAALLAALLAGYWRLLLWLSAAVVVMALIAYGGNHAVATLRAGQHSAKLAADIATNVLLVPMVAGLAVVFLMRRWGLLMFCLTYALSWGFFGLYYHYHYLLPNFSTNTGFWSELANSTVPWSLKSTWSTVAALLIIGAYLIVNAAFLQPYLGDAARYFRNSPANVAVRRAIRKNAVDTLDQLHCSRLYDRIVVVAHSLGTAVAYDMLRAYYSRICRQIPVDHAKLNPEFEAIDNGSKGPLGAAAIREQGRRLIAKLAANSKLLSAEARSEDYPPLAGSKEVDVWLVTDFVTLGSPLTHAPYLMLTDDEKHTADEVLAAHVRERELPTCPPAKLDEDRWLSFTDPEGTVRLHHGGLFGMTRWTNLFFPMKEIFWGDAIGGPVKDIFRGTAPEGYAEDKPVWTERKGNYAFFTHTKYWDTECPNRQAPHIQALIEAVDLPDKDNPGPPVAAAG